MKIFITLILTILPLSAQSAYTVQIRVVNSNRCRVDSSAVHAKILEEPF
jgi:hypothetical protein